MGADEREMKRMLKLARHALKRARGGPVVDPAFITRLADELDLVFAEERARIARMVEEAARAYPDGLDVRQLRRFADVVRHHYVDAKGNAVIDLLPPDGAS